MSVHEYWRQRLAEGRPFYNKDFMTDPLCTRRATDDEDDWPKAICRSRLYQDYLIWHQMVVVPVFEKTPYYQSNPEAIPKPVEEYVFYTTLAPYLYVIGKKEQVSNYRVNVPEQFNERTIVIKKFVYFVRLSSLRIHTMAFELHSGLLVGTNPPCLTNIDRCQAIYEELAPERAVSSAPIDINALA